MFVFKYKGSDFKYLIPLSIPSWLWWRSPQERNDWHPGWSSSIPDLTGSQTPPLTAVSAVEAGRWTGPAWGTACTRARRKWRASSWPSRSMSGRSARAAAAGQSPDWRCGVAASSLGKAPSPNHGEIWDGITPCSVAPPCSGNNREDGR